MARRIYDHEALAARLYDLLAAKPDGLDIHEIAAHLEIPREQADMVVRKLRLILGEGDSINVPVRIEGRRHVYYLAGRPVDGAGWQAIRVKTMLSRLDVDRAWWRSMVTATSGRTKEGRMARAVEKYFNRLVEDVEEIRTTSETAPSS